MVPIGLGARVVTGQLVGGGRTARFEGVDWETRYTVDTRKPMGIIRSTRSGFDE